MSNPKPDFSTDFSGPYPRARLIPKRLDAAPPAGDDAPSQAASTNTGEESEQPAVAATEMPGPHIWYEETTIVPDAFRKLLVEYSHIPSEEVDAHVVRVRNRAWEVHPFPCLGQFRFLDLNLAHFPGPLFPRLLSILTSGPPPPPPSSPAAQQPAPLFLDVGTCLGQDLRSLIHAGAPPHTLAGAELSPTFIALGHDLFRDDVRVVQADILAPLSAAGNPLGAWRGQLKVVQLGMVLHLFTWAESVRAFAHAVELLRDERGVMIVGIATGNVDGVETRTSGVRGTWKHNVESFGRLVRDVEGVTGMGWEVRARLDGGLGVMDGKRTWDDPRTRRLVFEIERVR